MMKTRRPHDHEQAHEPQTQNRKAGPRKGASQHQPAAQHTRDPQQHHRRQKSPLHIPAIFVPPLFHRDAAPDICHQCLQIKLLVDRKKAQDKGTGPPEQHLPPLDRQGNGGGTRGSGTGYGHHHVKRRNAPPDQGGIADAWGPRTERAGKDDGHAGRVDSALYVRARIDILVADDVVLPQVGTGLNLDHHHGNLARVRQTVNGAKRDVG